jgi:hypothetical protein
MASMLAPYLPAPGTSTTPSFDSLGNLNFGTTSALPHNFLNVNAHKDHIPSSIAELKVSLSTFSRNDF